MQFPVLYSRDTLGKVRIWFMEQDGHCYRMTSGLKNGELVTSLWTQCTGKNLGRSNETTPEQQATAEILAKYKKQKAQGGYFEFEGDIDNTTFFSPMLAHKWEQYSKNIDWKQGVYISPKMDGVRCIITKNGAFSRNGKPFLSIPHILRKLQPVFERFPDLILDGESYADKLSNDFNRIISLVKKTKPTAEDLLESERFIQFWIFDIPSEKTDFHNRYTGLQLFVNKYFPDNPYIKLCEHKLVYSEEDLEKSLTNYLQHGFEGLMVNAFDGKYESKRSQTLLKYKKFQDDDFEILDISPGIGNRSNIFGYATLKLPNGKTFTANARGNEEYYKELLVNKRNYIGKYATVRYQNLTPGENGVPRFPVIVSIRNYE